MDGQNRVAVGGQSCPFCGDVNVVLRNSLALACWDIAPASPGHLLLIPIRHEADFTALTAQELLALWELLPRGKALIERLFHPHGYNLGVNVGEAAGQTVAHTHLHLIPRFRGDVENLRGGVCAVIAGRQAEPVGAQPLLPKAPGSS